MGGTARLERSDDAHDDAAWYVATIRAMRCDRTVGLADSEISNALVHVLTSESISLPPFATKQNELL